MAKTSQATRNVRKFIKRQATGIKGRMVTDDYGNKLSVKKKPDGSFGRRHTLSRGKERAHTLYGNKEDSKNFRETLRNSVKSGKSSSASVRSITRHRISKNRRRNLVERQLVKGAVPAINNKTHTINKAKSLYHAGHSSGSKDVATIEAKAIHGTKRKSKDFTK